MVVLRPHGLLKLEEEHQLLVEYDLDRLPIRTLCKVVLEVGLVVGKRQIHMVLVVVHLRLHMVVRADERLRLLMEGVVVVVVVERHPDGLLVVKHLDMQVMEAKHLLMELLVVVGHLDGQGLVVVVVQEHVRPTHTLLKLDLRNLVDLSLLHIPLNNNNNNNNPALPTHTLLLRLIPPLRLSPDIPLLHHTTHLHPLVLLRLPLVVLSPTERLHLTVPPHHMELQHPTELLLRHSLRLKLHQLQIRYHGIGQWISGISSLKLDLPRNPLRKTQSPSPSPAVGARGVGVPDPSVPS